jgi:hypothetical protein
MGYFKRKQTKKRGKRGTKKYRGGAANAPVNAVPANANAAKTAAKEALVTHFDNLKSEFDKLDTQLPDFKGIYQLMSEINQKLDEYKAMFPVPETAM